MSLLEERYLSNIISKMAFGFGKMAFVAGPRQVGKTTLAKDLLAKRGAGKSSKLRATCRAVSRRLATTVTPHKSSDNQKDQRS